MRCPVSSRLLCIGILLACLALTPSMVFAQQSVSFDSIAMDYGSRTAYINDIIQDSRGLFWLATNGGLLKYDGYSITTYVHDPNDPGSISSNAAITVREDNEGTIWIGTRYGGLSRFERESGSFINYTLHSPERNKDDPFVVNCILQDRENSIWIGTNGEGLQRLNTITGETVRYDIHDKSSDPRFNNRVSALCETADNRLLVGTEARGLWEFDREQGTFKFLRYQPASEEDFDAVSVYSFWDSMSIIDILEDSSGGLWVGSKNGLFYSAGNDENFIQFEHNPNDPYSLVGKQISGLVEGHDGNIWIATGDAGLSRYEVGTKRFEQFSSVLSPGSPSNDSITSLYCDRLGSIWLGVFGYGLHKYSPLKHKFPYYTSKPNDANSLSDSRVYSILEDTSGRVWVGTLAGGLNSFDRRTNTFTHIDHNPDNEDGTRNGTILSLCEDAEGILWIGTVFGVDKLDLATGEITPLENNPANPGPVPLSTTRPIYRARDGAIWLGVKHQGLYRYDRSNDRFKHYVNDPGDPESLSSNTIKSIYQSRAGEYWVGTEGGGLNRFVPENESFIRYSHNPDDPQSLSDSWVYYIHEDSDGLLWLGTRNGINHFDPKSGKSVSYTVKDGLIDNVVYGILPESDHLLWMSTNKGLSRFNTRNKTFENFDHNNGLQNDEFNTGAYFRSEKGELFFGGQKGFHIFHPETIVRNETPPPVIFTSFKMLNEELLLDGTAAKLRNSRFSFDQNSVSFEFVALDYINSAENRYAYKLEGVDRQWVKSGTRRFVNYASLAPGDYVFSVRGANSHGVWNEEGASLKFAILPPFWDTWWFKSLLVIFAVASVFVIFRIRVQGLKKREQELENEVALRTDELKHKTELLEEKTEELEAFSYSVSHDLRNPLWQINLFSKLIQESPSTKLDEESAEHLDFVRQSCTKSLSIVNNLLKLSLVAKGDLSLEKVNLSKLVSSVAEDKIRVYQNRNIDMKIQDNVSAECDAGLIQLLLENLIDNAIKYSSGREQARIGFGSKIFESERQFCISDNGIGLNPEDLSNIFNTFHRVQNQTGADGHGIGLNICKRIVQHHGGRIWVESKLNVGSVFFFTLPTSKNNPHLS